jgi:hypothetical protein
MINCFEKTVKNNTSIILAINLEWSVSYYYIPNVAMILFNAVEIFEKLIKDVLELTISSTQNVFNQILKIESNSNGCKRAMESKAKIRLISNININESVIDKV